jgi:hypothetical protein
MPPFRSRPDPSPEGRGKRPRRASPVYAPKRSPSPPPLSARSNGKAPLPPQGALFQHGNNVPRRGPSLASQFASMDSTESQTWRRDLDRPPPTGPPYLRGMVLGVDDRVPNTIEMGRWTVPNRRHGDETWTDPLP